MIHARQSFDERIEFRAKDGAAERPPVPVIATTSGMKKIAHCLDDIVADSCPIKSALATANYSGFQMNRRVAWSQDLKARADRNTLAKKFINSLAKLVSGHWSDLVSGTCLGDNHDLERHLCWLHTGRWIQLRNDFGSNDFLVLGPG